MKEGSQEKFGQYTAPTENAEEPSRYQGIELLKQAPSDSLPGKKYEHSDKTRISIEEIITALENGPEALSHLHNKISTEFQEKISATRWSKRVFRFFEKCATAEKLDWPVYAFQIQRDINQFGVTVRNEFSSVLAEWHAAQLLERLDENAKSAPAHYMLDAGAGVDLLFYLPEKNSEGSFFAIQVKKESTRLTPQVETIENSTINAESKANVRASMENCLRAAEKMSKHGPHHYTPLVMRVPVYDRILEQKLVDNRTLAFIKTSDVDKWSSEMISFFRSKKYKKDSYGK